MKQLHFLRMAAIALILPLPAALSAQDFLNGGFEKNGNLCLINASVPVFNANVKSTHALGANRRPDIVATNCGQGDAKEGNWFIGLSSSLTSEAVTMELTQPLVKGSQYSLSFWSRGRIMASNLELGVSASDSTFGTKFYTVSSTSIHSSWTEITIRFTAPQGGKFISLRTQQNDTNSGVWLDGFHLGPVFVPDNVVVAAEPVKKNTVQPAEPKSKNVGEIYPNPSAGVFKVNADSSLLSLTVYNTLGTTVEEHKATAEEPVPSSIDLSDQQPGLYFVELATAEGKITRRIIVSR